jgi:hypothetical protein
MNSSDFDQRFDAGESVLEALDLGSARRLEPQSEPTYDELYNLLFDDHRSAIEFSCDTKEEGDIIIRNHIAFARAVLARYGYRGLERCQRLQQEQSRFREPERTIVCDILANGTLLPDPDGVRYSTPPQPVPAPCPTEPTSRPLSPSAQAVIDAAFAQEHRHDHPSLAAALRAAVKQTRKRKVLKTLWVTMASGPIYCLEADLLAIAAELDPTTTETIDD